MSNEVTNKFRFQVGSYYRISYDPDGMAESTNNVTGVFKGKNNDGTLSFDLVDEIENALVISPGEITTIVPIHSKRIQPKIKMGKPRGVHIPSVEVKNSQNGRTHFVTEEEAEILCRTFGYENLTKPPFTEGTVNGE